MLIVVNKMANQTPWNLEFATLSGITGVCSALNVLISYFDKIIILNHEFSDSCFGWAQEKSFIKLNVMMTEGFRLLIFLAFACWINLSDMYSESRGELFLSDVITFLLLDWELSVLVTVKYCLCAFSLLHFTVIRSVIWRCVFFNFI